jgi:hypothetical protein
MYRCRMPFRCQTRAAFFGHGWQAKMTRLQVLHVCSNDPHQLNPVFNNYYYACRYAIGVFLGRVDGFLAIASSVAGGWLQQDTGSHGLTPMSTMG